MKEIKDKLIVYEGQGLVTSVGAQELTKTIHSLVAGGQLAESETTGFPDGERRVRIAPSFSSEAQKIIEDNGYIIFDIEELSLSELIADLQIAEYIGPVIESDDFRSIRPPKTQIAIKPGAVFVEGSKKQMTKDMQKLVARESKERQEQFDRRDIATILFPGLSSALVQVDVLYQLKYGKKLIADNLVGKPLYLRTLDKDKGSEVDVGRGKPEHNIVVTNYLQGVTSEYVWAPAFIVPIEPLLATK